MKELIFTNSKQGFFEAHLGTLSLRSSTLLAIENSIRKFKQKRYHPVDATLRKLQTSLNMGSPQSNATT